MMAVFGLVTMTAIAAPQRRHKSDEFNHQDLPPAILSPSVLSQASDGTDLIQEVLHNSASLPDESLPPQDGENHECRGEHCGEYVVKQFDVRKPEYYVN